VLWNTFTLVGALAGDAIGDPKLWGLDGAAVAAFLGLLWPRLTGKDPVAVAVAAAVVTIVAVPLVPPGIPVLIAAAVTAGAWAWRHLRQRRAAS
jgi:predicted branched-subunit amino acid permease